MTGPPAHPCQAAYDICRFGIETHATPLWVCVRVPEGSSTGAIDRSASDRTHQSLGITKEAARGGGHGCDSSRRPSLPHTTEYPVVEAPDTLGGRLVTGDVGDGILLCRGQFTLAAR